MKKICFLVDSIFSIGGVQRVTAVIAESLSMDYDVTIITFDAPDQKDPSLYSLKDYPLNYVFAHYPAIGQWKEKACKAYSYIYKKVQPQGKWASGLYAHSSFPSERQQWLTTLLNAGDYDIIVGVHAFLAIRLATIRRHLKAKKVIGWIHNSFEALLNEGSPYLGTSLKAHYGWQLKKLDDVVVLYQQDAEMYQKAYGLMPTTIPNPLTLTPGKRSDGKGKRFLAVGRFSPLHKGFDLLIEAYALFARQNREWTLDIVGDGPEKTMLQQMIDQRRLGDRVKLHPFTTNVQHYYSAASIYVLSSRWEGFGLVMVEAMAHGVPVVSSDLPSSKDILGDFGIYFHNGNINELAQQLEEATRIDWQKKSEEAIALARHFDIAQINKQWKALFQQ